MRQQQIQWRRLFRRSAALFMATLAVWLLVVCAGAGAAAASGFFSVLRQTALMA